MEHRWHKRYPVNLSADVYYGDQRVSGCLIRDLSLEGLFLDCGEVHLPRGGVVDVVFSPPSVADGPCKAVRALVIHNMPGGVGLLLAEPIREWGRGAARQSEPLEAA